MHYVKPAPQKSTSRKAMESALNRLRGLSKTNLDIATVARYYIDQFRDQAGNARKKNVGALTIANIGNVEIPQLLSDTTLILGVRVWIAKALRSAGYPVEIEGRKIVLPREDKVIDYAELVKKAGKLDSAVTLALQGNDSKIRKFLAVDEGNSGKKEIKRIPLKDRFVKAVARYTDCGLYTTEQDKAALNCVNFIANHLADIEKIMAALQTLGLEEHVSIIESPADSKVAPVDFSDNKAVNAS